MRFDPSTMQTISQILIALGLLISALGGYGSFHFARKVTDLEKTRKIEEIKKADDEKANRVAFVLATTVYKELLYTIPIVNGFKENIKKGSFFRSNDQFGAIYSPKENITIGEDIFVLNQEVIENFDEYKRRVDEVAKHKNLYTTQLKKEVKTSKIQLVIYLISLDSLIRTGYNLLKSIESNYDKDMINIGNLPTYTIIDSDEIQKFFDK